MIDKEQRKEHIKFSKEILKILQEKTGVKLKRRVLKMVGNNPFIEIRVNNWEIDEIPNDILKIVCLKLGIAPLNWDSISYGNISNKGLTLYLNEWVRVLEVLKRKEIKEGLK